MSKILFYFLGLISSVILPCNALFLTFIQTIFIFARGYIGIWFN